MTEESTKGSSSGPPSSGPKTKAFNIKDLERRNTDSPPLWADYMEVAYREEASLAMLIFYASIPQAQDPPILLETARIQTSLLHIKSIIEVLCGTSGYYPERPESESSGSSESSESD